MVQWSPAHEFWTAAVCRNGHVRRVNIGARTSDSGGEADAFCGICGAAIEQTCENCNAPIRGIFRYERQEVAGYDWRPSNHCESCGAPYPWLAAALAAVREIATEEAGLQESDVTSLVEAASVLAREDATAQTEVAASRFRRIGARVGGKAETALWAIATATASVAVKKALGI